MYPARRYLTDEEVRLCDLSLTDEVRIQQKMFLRVFQFLGTTVMTRRENGPGQVFLERVGKNVIRELDVSIVLAGTLVCDWLSFSSCYSLFFLASHIYYIYVATVERQDLMTRLTNRSFDEDVFLYSLYIYFVFTGLGFTSLAESKKLVTYYNLLSYFQLRYYHIKGKRINLKFTWIHRNIYLSLGLILTTVLIVTYSFVINFTYQKVENHTLQPIIENVIACGFIIVDIINLLLVLMTNFTSLSRIASILVDEIQEAFETGHIKTVENYEKLWIDFVYITRQFGNAVSYSVGYYLLLAIVAITFEFYLAIREDYTVLGFFGGAIWFAIMSVLMTFGHLTYKLTDNLKFRLIGVRKQASLTIKRRLNKFFKLIRIWGNSISLGGFANLDNGLASSILKTITTFIIILLQFRAVDQNVKSEQ